MNGTTPLAPEVPVQLVANGTSVALLMCTPHDLDDLAIGHLVARGMLSDPAGVLSVDVRTELGVMTVAAPGAMQADRFGLGQVMASGHGSGTDRADGLLTEAMPPGLSVDLAALQAWSKAMFGAAVMFRQTGGMHCAALAAPSYFVVREDVGRHNAIDKVIGRGFVDRVDLASACVLTSGRIATDMILKVIAARIPVIASRSIPTTTAFELARRAGVTMVGRIGDEHPTVYTGPERILSVPGRGPS